jgi:hypothetical protein
MTNLEAIHQLDKLGQEHEDHKTADDILIEVMRSHNLADVADAYARLQERVTFYYS